MLFLFLLGIWGGAAGTPPVFKPEWAANSNSYLGPSLAQPVNK